MVVPDGLGWWRTRPGGPEWLDALPGLAADCAERWDLRLGNPFEPATISLVVPAERSDGTRAILKLTFPEPDSEHEPSALAHWGGDGAARLLEADPARAALLVERLEPGRQLRAVPDEAVANTIAAGVLRRLWSVPPAADAPFVRLEDVVARWAVETARRPPTQPRLVDLAAGLARDLLPSPGEPAVLHQDFHGGNVLLDADRGWLAIDPQPLVGEPRSTAPRWCATAAATCCSIPIRSPASACGSTSSPRSSSLTASGSAAGRSCTPSRGVVRPARAGTPPWSPARAGSPMPRQASRPTRRAAGRPRR
jgi:streptomycin 6-kinase